MDVAVNEVVQVPVTQDEITYEQVPIPFQTVSAASAAKELALQVSSRSMCHILCMYLYTSTVWYMCMYVCMYMYM